MIGINLTLSNLDVLDQQRYGTIAPTKGGPS